MLIEGLTVAGLIAGSFAATNIDNLALLVSWRLARRGPPVQLLAGHVLGMLVLLLLASAFGLGGKLVPTRYIGYLGVVPIVLGVRELYRLLRVRDDAGASPELPNRNTFMLSVATTQVANGVDTVLVFGPLLADSTMGVDSIMVGGFLVMALLWYGLARVLETHASRLEFVERHGHWVTPIVLIVVGLYILDNTATDLVEGM